LAADHEVTVFNRHGERAAPLVAEGARWAATPRQAVQGAEVVLAVLRDDEASRAVWTGSPDAALAALEPGAVAIESSTLTPAWVRALAETMRARDTPFLDAPVVGSRPQAEAGQLAFLVGGEAKILEAVRPLLGAMGGAIHHVGPTGAGATMKLAVNASLAIQAATLGETLGLLRRAGLDEGDAVAILGALPVASPAARALGALMAARDFAPRFPVALVEKDLRYALETARALGAELPVSAAAHAAFARAAAEGLAEENLSAILRLYV